MNPTKTDTPGSLVPAPFEGGFERPELEVGEIG
jgi:hypothetical protein